MVNLSDIQNLGKKVVDANILRSAGLIRRVNSPVKLLGNGTIKIATTISVEKASASAISAIESAGGKVILTAKPKMITKRKKEFNK